MLYKFETKTNRVKGLSFHPTRPWILTSLHSGSIHLYDYRIKTLLEKFEEHEGPVRGVNFHMTQPLFVSGGDDYKIKVWNYKQRRCLFTLKGHKDYVRTVEFHREAPWIVSSSDDMVIRIWNWQSRTCISELSGHNHYVMSALFHPKDDLVVSASLDQFIRVWDISGLKKKMTTVKPYRENDPMRIQEEIFGTDVIVKLSLEGHDRGVNWAAFHPTQPYIVSASDDHHVKLWRMNDPIVDTFRGHYNNVSCALFHPRQELIISNSEDKTIRVWDIVKKQTVHMIRRDNDRFWTLASHPNQNLFAAGHDSGMIVFKLERERPIFVQNGDGGVFYLKKKHFNSFDFAQGRSVVLFNISKLPSNNGTQTMSYNQTERAILISSDSEGGTYHLYKIPTKDSNSVNTKKGTGVAAIFVGRDRFAVLDKGNTVVVRDLENEEIKKCQLPFTVDWIYPGGSPGTILVQSEDRVYTYDIQQKKVNSEIVIHGVRYVIWSKDKNHVAFLTRDLIVLANKELEQICMVHETVLPKSGVWDEHGVFIYSTSNHLKYLLQNGDNGTIKTLESTIYITGVKDGKVFAIDREFKNRIIEIDPTEYILKLSLLQQNYNKVMNILKENRLVGKAIIAYLQKKGYPEVVHFVKDDRTRFNLALDCGNIEIALQSAKVLDDKECWSRLGVEALKQGNYQIVEMAYSRTSEFDRLSFLYLLVGNLPTLKKMMSYESSDIMSRFQFSLYLGDVEERIKILQEAGLHQLAFITASIHGLTEKAQAIGAQITADGKAQLPQLPQESYLLTPPSPINAFNPSELNWPLLSVAKSVGDAISGDNRFGVESTVDEIGGGWITDDEVGVDDDLTSSNQQESLVDVEDDGWDKLEFKELDKIGTDNFSADKKAEAALFVPPQPGPSFSQIWARNSQFAIDHIAAGSFEVAMNLLNSQIGAINFDPIKPLFMNVFMGARSSLGALPSTPSLLMPIQRKSSSPYIPYNLTHLIDRLKSSAYRSTTEGKFGDALVHFTYILHTIIFCTVETKQENGELKDLINICREYILGIKVELQRKDLATGSQKDTTQGRQTELAAYFTHCNLDSSHLILSLRSAMNCAYKVKHFNLAASFARRLISLNPNPDLATQAKKVFNFAQQTPTPADAPQVNYDERNPFVVCAHSFTPIYKGSALVKCPYCSSCYLPQYKGKVCAICQISEIGKETQGLQVIINQK
ncbi:hypothetical protein DICPUDRAFT_30022 [Dictyostelium purpureum]|uniref:Coatomer subunit alpha n=1 Tax=Dictyostelium purpureum TaxID=5786 RepID=F0ZEM4_DICPU|nr:uncharacterized protein DICPUDRAFT_30022 [Dictyostelium purpureum]EGC37596.1 hypothetical protein DICPUDRAFT_30022 [Dictyostelium purpureum]|eukprot:XP_003285857.1 hypothetical protein DICPUDRAFT_30022 [Dictyostelium purpureum]